MNKYLISLFAGLMVLGASASGCAATPSTAQASSFENVSESSVCTTEAAEVFAQEETVAVAEEVQPIVLDETQIQALIQGAAEKYGATGVQVAVVNAGEVVGTYAYGWATVDTDPMTADHKMRVASISKVLIGVTAMLLQEDGTVDLNADIGDYWGVTARNPMYPEVPITLRSLLTHTSSIICYGDDYATDYSSVRSRLSGGYSNLLPGDISSWYYNNYAFSVLGMTLELAADKTLNSILAEKLFRAMDIDAAFASGDLQNTDMLVTLYRENGSVARTVSEQKSLHTASDPGGNGSYFAGGLTISAADLAKIVAMLAGDGVYEAERFLTAGSVEQMEEYIREPLSDGSFQALPLFYASELFGREGIYFHPGSAYGVYSCISYDSVTGDGVVVLTTGAAGTSEQYDIALICSEISQDIYSLIA